jgi:S-adenosylmethionine:tRNA ribosyltransferase-isomerase
MAFLNYDLPAELIAQEPAAKRDQARLLVVRRDEQSIAHHVFANLPDLLAPGDLIVLNDTRVVPARLLGRRERTGGKWEGLFLRETDGVWEMLCQTRGTLSEGETILIEREDSTLPLTYIGRTRQGHFLFRSPNGMTQEVLARFGHVPLPPYIRKGADQPGDAERYQTVFARTSGAVAAPTAGLHFTEHLFQRLADCGIERTFVTLHVGLGTFQPLQSDDPAEHVMHAEWCQVPESTATSVATCRARGGRIIAVGTTAVRTLESAQGRPFHGETNLYIHPPYQFRHVDALVTNFHLPRTSLLLLAGAFAGEELLRRAYESAIAERYRFYSYGDAMLIL